MASQLGGLLADLDVLARALGMQSDSWEQHADELYLQLTGNEHGDPVERQRIAGDYWGLRARADLARSVSRQLDGLVRAYAGVDRAKGRGVDSA